MNLPTPTTLNLRLANGDVLEVDAVRVTMINEERGLQRVEWYQKESIQEPGKVIYGKRWEGSRRMVEKKPPKPLNAWLLGIIK